MQTLAQGSWNPQGADLSFPRSLLDSMDIPAVRASLANPGIIELYHSIWNTANSTIPAGNTTDGDRISRAVIAREAAFVALMNRKWENGEIKTLTPAERDSMTTRATGILSVMNTSVGYQSGWVFYQEWQHRSKELILYLTAYDLLRGAGISPAAASDSLISFTGNLYKRAMATYTIVIFHIQFFDFQFDNHSIMTASALGMAAVVLNDHEDADINRQPVNWINAGLWNLDNTLYVENGPYPRVSEPGVLAGYAEGPGYFAYAFQNAFPFIRSLYNFLADGTIPVTFKSQTREIRNPWYDARYDSIYDWMIRIRMPDGSEPAIHDSPIGFKTMITALSGKPRFNIPFPGCSYDDPFIRTQYIATRVTQGSRNDSIFEPLPDAGSLIFRSSPDPSATCMHFIGKHGIPLAGAKSHHQGDASSFSLVTRGQLMAVDPGYPGAPESDYVNKAWNHNCILVNGGGPQPPNGEFVSVKSNTAFIEDAFSLPAMDYGEVRTSYWGDSVIRCNIFPGREYFILSDLCSAPGKRRYTFQFHGNGLEGSSPSSEEGSFDPMFAEQRGLYRRDTVSLLVQVQSDKGNPVMSSTTDSLATGSSSYRHYSRMLANPDSASALSFQTVIYPYASQAPEFYRVLPGGDFSASIAVREGKREFMLTQFDTVMRLVSSGATGLDGDVRCKGQLGFLTQEISGQVTAALIRGGSLLSCGSRVLARLNHPMLFAWNETAPARIEGYAGDSGTVELQHTIRFMSGSAIVTGISYDSSLMMNIIRFNGKGKFILEPFNGISGPGEDESPRITAFPNPSKGGHFSIRINSSVTTSARLTITGNSGEILIVGSVLLTKGENVIPLDLSSYPAGEYLVSLASGKAIRSIKLIAH
jgi:hypothetical protein